eukprot:TRINITY_DN104638_c0_g1_i1.p1 TRINITY_DN104638_c0_g1~~TRINITY_DN104638_c0_g1_i1.p1  ORF type:complete len:641 (+),score=94.56 TRINITY_DN104638_c0_g1_i1:42-1964(+)
MELHPRVSISELDSGAGPSLSIHIRLPSDCAVPEARFLRSAGECLQVQLQKLITKLGPKPEGKRRNTAACLPASTSEVSLCVLDSMGAVMPTDKESGVVWPMAIFLRISGLHSMPGSFDLPVHWNPPSVDSAHMCIAPMVGVPILAQVSCLYCTKADCSWTWQRRVPLARKYDGLIEDAEVWVSISQGQMYTPTCEDEGCLLRFVCFPPAPGDCLCSAPNKHHVVAAPDDAWRWKLLPAPPVAPVFRLVTYNVLADAYASTKAAMEGMFSYCNPQVLAAPIRRQRIIHDILNIDADIVGLQEVDSGQLACMAVLDALGWDSIYTRKLGAAADGCALFWRRSRFRLEGDAFELPLGGALDTLPTLDPTVLFALSRHERTKDVLGFVTTVAQGVVLRDLSVPAKRLLVANTHLFYHPDANHIRLLQLHMLLCELGRRKIMLESDGCGDVALVLLGDLNARKGNFGPSDIGRPPQAAYRLVRDGIIFEDDPDWQHSLWRPDEWRSKKIVPVPDADEEAVICICCRSAGTVDGYGECPLCEGCGILQGHDESLETIPSSSADTLLQLELALPTPLSDPNEHLQVTTYTSTFQECLDYTLLDSRNLRAVATMDAPSIECLSAETALPSAMFPSDHIPVVVDVEHL